MFARDGKRSNSGSLRSPTMLSPVNVNTLNGHPSLKGSSKSSLPPRSPRAASPKNGRRVSTTTNLNGEAVQVAVRCRPCLGGEKPEDTIVSMDAGRGEVHVQGESQIWKVDAPLWSCRGKTLDGKGPVTQAGLYEQLGRPLLLHALEGYNSTLMAYGQTGSGKTYTMMGNTKGSDDYEAGIIPRLCNDLFAEIQARSFTTPAGESLSWEVHVRYVEVYCEKVSDLLNSNAPVCIREEVTPQSAVFALIGATRVKAERSEDLLQALSVGNKSRHTAATKANDRSSRSHAIFIIELTELLSFEEPDGTVISAPNKALTLRLVDLAGSERVGETGVQGQQLKEARDINLSLFTLGLVIESLTDNRRQIKPPYRDSVLTKILRDAFGGNSKTTMICAISPVEANRSQTLNTLNYASKARRVFNKPIVEEDPSAIELRRANEELINLRRELSDAKRSGQQYESIEVQLREAYEKLKRDQLEIRERKQKMEKREMELANRLREIEMKKSEYDAQMAALEGEVELARKQQKLREVELRQAYAQADEEAQARLSQLQAQRDASEQALRAKEEELLIQQQVVEERLAELEVSSRARVEELLRRQRDLEEELRTKETLAAKREQDLKAKTQLAESQARMLSQRTHTIEQEWDEKVREIERRAEERELAISRRAEMAQNRLRALENEAKQRDEEIRQKRIEIETRAAAVEAEMELKQQELDQRMLELNRQAEKRENELNEKLRKAEFELHKKERESMENKDELNALKEASERMSELSRSRELNLSAQHAKMAETISNREEKLAKREAELNEQFENLLATKKEWEAKLQAKEDQLRVEQEESASILRGRAEYLKQKENELHQLEEELDGKSRAAEMELQRRELEIQSRKNDMDAQLQRERHAHLRSKEEVQFQMDRQETELRLLQEKLHRWEEELLKRRSEQDKLFHQREMALRQRESAAAIAEDRAVAKEAQADKLNKRLEQERRELFDRSINDAEVNRKEYNSMILTLRRQQRELDNLRRNNSSSNESTPKSPVRDVEAEKIIAAQKSLFKREIFSLFAFESMYRGSIIVEEGTQFRCMMKERQMEARDLKRVQELRLQMGELSVMRGETERVTDEHQKAQERVHEYQRQINDLKDELTRTQSESAQLRVQLNLTTSIAHDAEDSLQRVNRDMDVSRVQADMVEKDLRAALFTAQSSFAEEMRRANRLSRALQSFFFEQEERERSLIEYQRSREAMWIKGLELSERKGAEKLNTIEKWESLYQERSAIDLDDEEVIKGLNRDALFLHENNDRDIQLELRERGLIAEQEQLQQRVDAFDSLQRTRLQAFSEQEKKIKQYLLEIEALDKECTARHRAQERELIDLAMQLKAKEGMSGSQLHGICQALFTYSAGGDDAGVPRAVIEEDGRNRLQRIQEDRELCIRALDGDRGALEELKRRQEEFLLLEDKLLQNRVERADLNEARRYKRLKDQEEQIQQYLLLLEQEDIRRHKLSTEGQLYYKEAEGRLYRAKKKEAALRDLARRLQLEALELEEQSRLMESNLQQRERDLDQLREKKAEVEQRRVEANSRIEDTERTLLDLESDLRALINKNKNTKQIIKARDAELKRQRQFYLDLSKMLEERDRMLLEEHNHRMDGKKSANWLARDLLDRNTKLEKYAKSSKDRLRLLLVEGLLECDLCSWKNNKDQKFCKCCGHDLLLPDPLLENI